MGEFWTEVSVFPYRSINNKGQDAKTPSSSEETTRLSSCITFSAIVSLPFTRLPYTT